MTDRLYQYTTPDGLIGIVTTNQLWATNAFYLNDSKEVVAGIDIARNHLRGLREASSDESHTERIDYLLESMSHIGTAASTKYTFVSCLTTQDDQLSQWRAYCRNGGFAIGFPTDRLRECAESQHFRLEECVYDVDAQLSLITKTVDDATASWILKSSSTLDCDSEQHTVAGTLVWEVLRTTARIKDNGFSEECEYRLISQPELPFDKNAFRFRTRNGLIIPYITIELPKDEEFWRQVEVRIGPTEYAIESEASVRNLFRKDHDHAMIPKLSNIPYREW